MRNDINSDGDVIIEEKDPANDDIVVTRMER